MLLRDAVGDGLRDARTRQHRTLRDVSTAANVSLGYLSEVERGRKEASSELLASICDALDLELSDLLDSVSRTMRTEGRTAAGHGAPVVPKAVLSNSAKPGVAGSAKREQSIRGGHIDPTIRIVVPYGASRPEAPVA